jgi:hypothetical protein
VVSPEKVCRLRIYCEHGSLTAEIRQLCREGNIELVHFPFDPDSHTRKTGIAAPSEAQIRDLNLPIASLPGTIADYSGSRHLTEIVSTIGESNRRDALHLDSAVRSGCSAFITDDSDILQHKAQLEILLGIKLFSPGERRDFEQFIEDKLRGSSKHVLAAAGEQQRISQKGDHLCKR